ncbi:unnamed protein product [Angiostrongylus costaricensis]|uniref:Calponin-homology (CH) domain-containing protein n=1 Tax=Angiostrongylus costaricensis TaxID=334426 RepID=A0A0R3PE36_ANGCS|nr:unnamed protein product [Angiostrongylus costaricensis]
MTCFTVSSPSVIPCWERSIDDRGSGSFVVVVILLQSSIPIDSDSYWRNPCYELNSEARVSFLQAALTCCGPDSDINDLAFVPDERRMTYYAVALFALRINAKHYSEASAVLPKRAHTGYDYCGTYYRFK